MLISTVLTALLLSSALAVPTQSKSKGLALDVFPQRVAVIAKIKAKTKKSKSSAKTTAKPKSTVKKVAHKTTTTTPRKTSTITPRKTSTKYVGKYSTKYTPKPTTTSKKPAVKTTSSTKKSTTTSSTKKPATTTTTQKPTTTTSTSTQASTPTYVAPAQDYYLSQSNRGANFYSNGNWDFWAYTDPTHGKVTYVSEADAVAQGLAGIDAQGRAFAAVSTLDLPLGQNRPSVRFQSQKSWDGALVVFDVAKMPVGCASWPALWTVNGATWPENGEIDVMEGVGSTSNGANANLVSLHMNDTAIIQTSTSLYGGSTLVSSNCMTNYGLGNTGCSFHDSNSRGPSWGPNFNAQGGGVWAMQFGNNGGVKTWFWGRNSAQLPAELRSPSTATSALVPSNWGKPMANFQNPIINEKLNGQQIVLDITIAGDWAGNVPMDGTCGKNYTTAIAKGSNYVDANFLLNGIDVYCLGSAGSC